MRVSVTVWPCALASLAIAAASLNSCSAASETTPGDARPPCIVCVLPAPVCHVARQLRGRARAHMRMFARYDAHALL